MNVCIDTVMIGARRMYKNAKVILNKNEFICF